MSAASDKVIVLTESELADVIVGYSEKDKTVQDKLRAALDRDPDELVEQVAEAAYDAYNRERSIMFEQVEAGNRVTADPVRAVIRAAIAALTEDARTGGGEGNG